MNEQPGRGRLVAWLCFVAIFASLQYAAYFGTDAVERVPEDFLYRYSSAIFGVVQFGVMLGIALLITIGLPKRPLFGLQAPRPWGMTGGWGALITAALVVGVVLAVLVVSGVVGLFLDPGEEQGLLPDRWRPERAAQYAVNFVVVAGLVPIVEELLFRGLGFTLLRRFGDNAAVIATGVLFAAAHGLVEAFPVIAVFGLGLAFLRARTESVYPCMAAHAVFNSIAMLAVFAQSS
jgi:membrane protease YdiL (CAAX protease family)